MQRNASGCRRCPYAKSIIKRNSPVVAKMKEPGYIDDENKLPFA